MFISVFVGYEIGSVFVKYFDNLRRPFVDPSHVKFKIDPTFIFNCTLAKSNFVPFMQLAHGADPSMRNQEGETPLDLATVSKRLPVYSLANSIAHLLRLSLSSSTPRSHTPIHSLLFLPAIRSFHSLVRLIYSTT